MPSRKIFSILIICIAIVTSTWLLLGKSSGTTGAENANSNTLSVRSYSTTTNDDWKKMIASVNTTTEIAPNLIDSGQDTPDDTTLTSQLSIDLMSRYLLMKKGGATISTDDATNIAKSVMSSPQYSQISAAVYVESNLHTTNANDTKTLTRYRDGINLVLKNRSAQVDQNSFVSLSKSIKSGDFSQMSQLNPLIEASKGLISDLLSITVPKDALKVHLDLLNATSNVLESIKGMQETFVDPVKGYIALNQYTKNMADFQTALGNMNLYFTQRLGSSQ